MPRAYLMSYEGAPYFRWVKMYTGVRDRVTFAELRAPLLTKEGSARLANEWWERKLASLVNARDPRLDAFLAARRGEDELTRLTREYAALERERNRLRDELDNFARRVAEDQGEGHYE